jgi:hypothetical protein
MSILAELGGYCGSELGDSDDVVEGVDLHDFWKGAAGRLEELEDAVPRLLQRRRGRRHLHGPHRKRHCSLLLLWHRFDGEWIC